MNPTAASAGSVAAPLRIGLIGCGRLGTRLYIPAIQAAEGMGLAAIAEPDLERGLQARELCAASASESGAESPAEHAPAFFPSAETLIHGPGLDGVVIASPPAEHLAQARLAAAAGIPALVEKPPADDSSEAEQLIGLDPAPAVGFNRRFVVPSEFLAPVPAGSEVELSLDYMRRRWRPHAPAPDAIGDIGCHLLDLALLTVAPAPGTRRIRAIELTSKRGRLELAGDRGTARISFSVNRPWRERFEITAAGERLAEYRAGGLPGSILSRFTRGPDPLRASIDAQLRAFADRIRGLPAAPLATAADGAAAMIAIDAARQSAASGGSWVEFGPGSAPDGDVVADRTDPAPRRAPA